MEDRNQNNGFSYTYSAKEQEELKRIRAKYQPTAEVEEKMARLRKLDSGVTQKAQIMALIFGVIGTLILGLGMSLAISDFSAVLGAYRDMAMLIGVILGLIGIVLISLAYPVYQWMVKRERKRVAPEILKLTDELIK